MSLVKKDLSKLWNFSAIFSLGIFSQTVYQGSDSRNMNKYVKKIHMCESNHLKTISFNNLSKLSYFRATKGFLKIFIFSIIGDLQCSVNFYYTTKWPSHIYMTRYSSLCYSAGLILIPQGIGEVKNEAQS